MNHYLVKLAKHTSMPEAVRWLENMGFHVDREIPDLNLVSGSAQPSLIEKLRNHPKVKRIREEENIQIGPFIPSIPQ